MTKLCRVGIWGHWWREILMQLQEWGVWCWTPDILSVFCVYNAEPLLEKLPLWSRSNKDVTTVGLEKHWRPMASATPSSFPNPHIKLNSDPELDTPQFTGSALGHRVLDLFSWACESFDPAAYKPGVACSILCSDTHVLCSFTQNRLFIWCWPHFCRWESSNSLQII